MGVGQILRGTMEQVLKPCSLQFSLREGNMDGDHFCAKGDPLTVKERKRKQAVWRQEFNACSNCERLERELEYQKSLVEQMTVINKQLNKKLELCRAMYLRDA
jgi:hypothetical protein